MDYATLAINAFDRTCIDDARAHGFGLEVDAFVFPAPPAVIEERKKETAALIKGFSQLSLHGDIIDRELEKIHAAGAEAWHRAYNASFAIARAFAIDRIVFHGNYWAQGCIEKEWLREQTAFWKRFLQGKPMETRIYIENYIDDTPYLLADLCDAVDDPRFGICLDTGHAHCNSPLEVTEWIRILGHRTGHVHLHNNDGLSDKHWPLGQGTLDINEVLCCLKENASPRMIVLECDYERSRKWLESEGRSPC